MDETVELKTGQGASGASAVEDSSTVVMAAAPAPYSVAPVAAAPAAPAAPALPQRIGVFAILSLLGRGGMGSVYEAEQSRPRRAVALKVIDPGCVSARMLRRFEVEVDVLGRLEHPGIARIYETGMAGDEQRPQPWFAMELVRGRVLTQYADEEKLSADQRLELLARVCDAVHYAHQRGIIHRDLKPGNILVDATGSPKVLDFGIARVTDGDVQVTTCSGEGGGVIGTVPYMSPEQAGGDPAGLDTRSDVYALGVLAFQLLTGRLPHPIENRPTVELLRAIRFDEPPSIASIDPRLRGDVDAIICKALEKDRDRRYASAAGLAADIRRYLDDEPVTARTPTISYRFGKFARRHTLAVALMVGLMLALLGGLVATSVALHGANLAKADASTAAQKASDEATQSRLHAQEAERARNEELIDQAGAWDLAGYPARAREKYREALEKAAIGGQIAWPIDPGQVSSWHRSAPPVSVIEGNGKKVQALAILADGHTLAVQDISGDRQGYDARYGRLLEPAALGGWEPPGRTPPAALKDAGPFVCFATTPDAKLVVSGQEDGTLKLWDAGSGKVLRSANAQQKAVMAVAFAGKDQVISGGADKTLKIWKLPELTPIATLSGHRGGITSLAVSADGNFALTGSTDRTVRLWDLAHPAERRVFDAHQATVSAVAFGPDGRLAASGSLDGELALWDLNADPVQQVDQSIGPVDFSAISPDGLLAFVKPTGRPAAIVDVATGRTLAQLDASVERAAFTSDLRRVMLSGPGTALRLWDLEAGRAEWSIQTAAAVQCLTMASDGRVFAGEDGGAIQVIDSRGQVLSTLQRHEVGVCAIATDAKGGRVLSGGYDNRMYCSDLSPSAGHELRAQDVMVTCLAISSDGKRAISGDERGMLRLWDLETHRPVMEVRAHDGRVNAVALSSDDRWALSGGEDGSFKITDLQQPGHAPGLVVGDGSPISSLTLTAGGWVAVTHAGGVWDFGLPARWHAFGAPPGDAGVAAVAQEIGKLGRWYGSFGPATWGVELLRPSADAAPMEGAALLAARSLWRLGSGAEAAAEFESAERTAEAPAAYLRLCAMAARKMAGSSPTDR